jgi:hypothetical protein
MQDKLCKSRIDATSPTHLSASIMAASKKGQFTFRITPETLKALDDLRRAEPDLPSRGEMLRRLVERAKAAQAKKEN